MHIKDLVVTGNARVLGVLQTKDGEVALKNHTHSYLPLAGGNLSGHLYLTGANEGSSVGSTSQIVFGTSNNNHVVISSNSNALVINPTTSSTTNQIVLYLDTASLFPSGITSSAAIQAPSFTATSDRRLKENIEEFKPTKSVVDLPIVKFNFIGKDTPTIGCLAQDLQEICPEIVTEGTDGYLAIQESKIVYLLLDEIKKQNKRLAELEAKL